MEYRTVGATGVRVSPLCLGTMSFGAEADEQTSAAMFQQARELDLNFFDTADVYAGGRSEEILGRLIADCRDEVVLTSKAFFPTGPDINAQGSSRRYLVRAVEASLRRLGTEWIDFYFVHAFDVRTPIEETLRALDDLQRQGKIRYPAVSNWAAWQIAKALGISAKDRLARFELIQPMYNLVRRQAEVEIMPLAESEKLGVITYSPLGGGLLTGKYGTSRRPETGRLVDNERYARRYGQESDYVTAEKFTDFCAQQGVAPATLAVAWAMSAPAVTAPIIGGRDLDQLADSLAALDIDMTPDLREEISQLSPPPPPATDRTETRDAVLT
ncbi:aldo/keto reductase [Saccharopolyspora aridisoli]|uniref:Aldo/keto reductase n=1 Tax=Saccharopolyspora aridisoli TaxID=2530385 RepID=A0A4R4U9P7_9PSEU|nr:aldo/keto reductase [Saccharopolyspora aridisoli]TDC88228.1 aldo/keto reductase [Saccharopolyspora aridisoli]